MLLILGCLSSTYPCFIIIFCWSYVLKLPFVYYKTPVQDLVFFFYKACVWCVFHYNLFHLNKSLKVSDNVIWLFIFIFYSIYNIYKRYIQYLQKYLKFKLVAVVVVVELVVVVWVILFGVLWKVEWPAANKWCDFGYQFKKKIWKVENYWDFWQ